MPAVEITEHPLGLTWVAQDPLLRAAHALVHEDRVWLVDPFEDEAALARVAALGRPAGVLQLFVGHGRDGEAIAQRLGVPFLSLPGRVADAPFTVLRLDQAKLWKERALWWPEHRGLVVAESVGTATHYAIGPGAAGVHVFRRAFPPRSLAALEPEHLLVGHGAPLHGPGATTSLHEALDRSRRDIPALFRRGPRLLRSMKSRS
jgi:hypothetical protein